MVSAITFQYDMLVAESQSRVKPSDGGASHAACSAIDTFPIDAGVTKRVTSRPGTLRLVRGTPPASFRLTERLHRRFEGCRARNHAPIPYRCAPRWQLVATLRRPRSRTGHISCCWQPCSSPPLFFAADFTGRVVGIIDGDTLEVLRNTHSEYIRLSGIDCPEKGQAYGNNAKQATSALAFGKEVTIQTHGKDKYKRTLGDVILPDGMNLNQELVKQGWCWWYRTYAPGDTVLEGLEKETREAKKGLWADPQPVPPWEWRKRKLR